MSSLFRQQVVDRRRRRLYGDVVVSDTRTSSFFVLAIALFLTSLLSWAAFAQYPRTERVPGIVITSAPSAKIYAHKMGTVKSVFVNDGDVVRKGQRLAFVSVGVRGTNELGYAKEVLDSLMRQRQLVKAKLLAARERVSKQTDRLKLLIGSKATEVNSLDRQIDIQRRIALTANKTADRLEPLAKSGILSRVEFENRRNNALIDKQQLEQMIQKRAQLQSTFHDLSARLDALPAELKSAEIELQIQLQTIAQQASRASIEVGYTLVAPIAGRITSLQAGLGRKVDTQHPLMSIIPVGAEFEAVIFATSRAAGFVVQGQEVRLMYDAFPYKQFGSFKGVVSSVSQSALAPAELNVPLDIKEPVYRVRVQLDDEHILAFGKKLDLQTGMTLTANIVLERRTFLDWLLEPLDAVRNRT